MEVFSVASRIESQAFRFSGQSSLGAWTLKEHFERHGWSAYDSWLTHEPVLCFQRIRELVDAFPTWQRRRATGRPSTDERTILVASLVRQFLGVSFRELESYLRLLADFFDIDHIPDANTISRSNRSTRFAQLLRRFHRFILHTLPKRESVIATDATGYSNQKNSWRETDYGLRATQDWLKSHCAVEVPSLLYLSTVTTKGRVHESQVFEEIWSDLPDNVQPRRSLADSAYSGDHCLNVAYNHGATPLHGIKKSARHTARPHTKYEDLVNFATHWPRRFAKLTGPRSLIETTFSATKELFGHRLRCRHPIARRNEIQAKQTAHNIRTITMRDYIASN